MEKSNVPEAIFDCIETLMAPQSHDDLQSTPVSTEEARVTQALAAFQEHEIEIDVLYDSDDNLAEDLIVVNAPRGIVGVLDGVSEFYSSSQPQKLFEGQSGGQIVGQVIKETLETISADHSLSQSIFRANRNVADRLLALGHPLDSADRLPGATGGVLQFDFSEKMVEIVAWGDTLVTWETQTGHFCGTSNQVVAHDREMTAVVVRLMNKHSGDLEKMWNEFLPIVLPFRAKRINNPAESKHFGLLNGQPQFTQMIETHRLSLDDLSHLAVFSDGLLPLHEFSDGVHVAQRVLSRIRRDGFRSIVQQTRDIERRQKDQSHTEHSEATGVSFRFT